jgi:PKD repeat protein
MKRLLYTFLFLGTIFGCSKTDTTPVTPKPIADFSWTDANGTIQFTSNSKNADSYQWDFGDNLGKSTSQNPKYTFEYKGDYQVKLIAKGAGGEAEAINTIKITTGKEPKPIPNFDIKDLGKGKFQFTNKSKYADTYEWDFGDKTTIVKDSDTEHQYYDNAKFKVTLTTIGKGGKEIKTQEVEAKDVPDPRDIFVGIWSGNYRVTSNKKNSTFVAEGTGRKTFSKSNFNKTLLFTASGGVAHSNIWETAIVTNNTITWEVMDTPYTNNKGKAELSSDGKILNVTENAIFDNETLIYVYVLTKQ